ncbi:MAG TPA: hypothetical protein DEO54_00680 [Rikenellaceae bacterium]|nr:MAG: hypothetical protein A2X20_01370 [Bacteroidetes bacterium GWE2_40_15]HBZ24738.1 hypothetical protein [Rikenellaceae bacterium]
MNKLYLSRSRIAQSLRGLLLLSITMIAVIQAFAANSIQVLVTFEAANMPITAVLDKISKQTNVAIFQNNNQTDLAKKVTVNFKNEKLENVLENLLSSTNLTYRIENDLIVIIPTKEKESVNENQLQQTPKEIEIEGLVVDVKGEPLIAVNILVVGTTKGTSTDLEGKFKLKVPVGTTKIKFSYIGFDDLIMDFNPSNTASFAKVVMNEAAYNIDNVVVTGYFDRTKSSFTGSQVTVKGDELRKVGSLNFMQAISAFDPSIRIVPNTEFGSDPNRVPEITIRGENGFDLRSSADDARSNPNAPLYLLDGIEVSPTRVYDLDMNRIDSFVILKDASATSLYGSRGANGVILITTIPPKEGVIRVSANANFTVSIPDLRDYNLMNATEKLEYEKLAGVFKSRTNNREEQIALDIKYNDRLAEVVRGVDTYWLSKPLRTSINQRYNAFVEGGDRSFKYGITLNYDSDKGVMKGSGRERYGINVSFNYNIGTNFLIRNDLTINNVEGSNSPYGSFSTYALQNPIERAYDKTTGNIIRTFAFNNAVNPLVNANLPNTDINKYTEFQDNFNMDWRINKNFRVTGRASISKNLSKTEKYLSPLSSAFDKETDANKRGSYTTSNRTDINFDGNITASYNNTFADKITANVGVGSNAATTDAIGDGYTATGFLSDNMRFVQYAQQFKENSKPSGSFDKSRLIGFFANVNLGYDSRYYIDVSFRTDGSSRFGKESRFAPFWSFGAAWNIDREKWWNSDATLKLRASVGSTGSVNFSADQAITKYQYNSSYEYNGVYGAQLLGYGNPALRWQNTIQNNIGFDLNMWKNIVVLNMDAYIKQTQNLLLPIDVAPSTGFSSYTENLGSMENKGLDMRLRFNIIRNYNDGLNWNVTIGASSNKNKIKNLSNALEAMNQEANSQQNVTGPKPLRTYQAGRSQSALMVVESLGIDPATGNEIFRKLNGDLTFVYDPKDKILVGDVNPSLLGTIQSNLIYKGFNLYVVMAYEYGAKIYNSTLAQKVEGSSPYYNADKRVLYDRWKSPGDVALFKRIDDTSAPYQTTRLVQKNNFLRLQTLSLSYELPKKYLEKANIERAKLVLSTSDLFRLSTVKIERGTSYPFAQTFSLSLNLTF